MAKYEDKHDLRFEGHKSHFGFGSIHPSFFVWSRYYKSNDLDLFPRSLDTATRLEEMFDAAFYFSQRSPALLHKFEHFKFVRDHAEAYHNSGADLRKDFEGEGAWNQGNDIDPKLTDDEIYPTRGIVCDTMK